MSNFSYDESAYISALDCANKAATAITNAGQRLSELSNSINSNYLNVSASDCNNMLQNIANSFNDALNTSNNINTSYSKNPFDIYSLPSKLSQIKDTLDVLASDDAGLSKLLEIKDKYGLSENKANGFELWLSNSRYSLSDFANSKLAKQYGLTGEEALNCFIAVCVAESDKTADGILAIVSVALNRCERNNWLSNYDNGTNPFDQMFAKGGSQYEVITNSKYVKYINSDSATKEVGLYNTGYSYSDLREVVESALTDGVRNNDYTGFRSNGFGYSDNKINSTAGEFGYENPSIDKAEAETAKAARKSGSVSNLTLTLDSKPTNGQSSNINPSQTDTPVANTDTGNVPSGGGNSGGGYSGGASEATQQSYSLIIKYVYQSNPMEVIYTEVQRFTEGTTYNVTSREIPNYIANPSIITGVMPSSDTEVTVIYIPIDNSMLQDITEYEINMNIPEIEPVSN